MPKLTARYLSDGPYRRRGDAPSIRQTQRQGLGILEYRVDVCMKASGLNMSLFGVSSRFGGDWASNNTMKPRQLMIQSDHCRLWNGIVYNIPRRPF